MNYLAIIIITCATVATIGCSSTPEKKPRATAEPVEKTTGPSPQELFLRGNEQLDAGNWKKAAATYHEVVSADPKRWDAHVNKAIAFARLGDLSRAVDSINAAFQNGAEREPEVYYNLGNIYLDFGLYPQAIDAYRAGFTYRDGPHVDSLINIGACYVFLRNWDRATETYEYAQEVAPDDPRALHGRALVFRFQEDYSAAEKLFDEVHAMAPDFALPYLTEAEMFGQQARYDDAIIALQRFLSLTKDEDRRRRGQTLLERYQRLRSR